MTPVAEKTKQTININSIYSIYLAHTHSHILNEQLSKMYNITVFNNQTLTTCMFTVTSPAILDPSMFGATTVPPFFWSILKS